MYREEHFQRDVEIRFSWWTLPWGYAVFRKPPGDWAYSELLGVAVTKRGARRIARKADWRRWA